MSDRIRIACTDKGEYLIGTRAIHEAEREGRQIQETQRVYISQLQYKCVVRVGNRHRLCPVISIAERYELPITARYEDAIRVGT